MPRDLKNLGYYPKTILLSSLTAGNFSRNYNFTWFFTMGFPQAEKMLKKGVIFQELYKMIDLLENGLTRLKCIFH